MSNYSMLLKSLLFTIVAFSTTEAAVKGKRNVNLAEAFKNEGVVTDIIDTAPSSLVKIQYGGKTVNLGNTFTPNEVQNQPTVINWDADSGKLYFFAMVDPDAPSRQQPKFREFQHWLVGNVPGKNMAQGEVLAEYIGSSPPSHTGYHRYIFLVYEQPSKMTFDEAVLTTQSKNRGKFSIRNFAKKYKLGEPIAGNFFQSIHV